MPSYVPTRPQISAALVLSLTLAGCRSYTGPLEDPASARATTTTTAATTTTTVPTTEPTTTVPPTTVAVPAPAAPPAGMGQGASGPEVLALEQRLAELRYDVGAVDGRFDSATHHAVMAFQKAEGLPRTARATPEVVTALAGAAMPAAQLADGGANRIEIDLKRQILTLWQGGELVRTLSVSTGTGKRYCVDGQCAKAVTPGGSFKVTRKINGLRVSRLGKLYNPLYFNGGIAIHGSGSVPAGPASHGCVRIPMTASKWFHDTVPIGTPVYVLGGVRAPVPFNEQAPGDEDPATTTTVPATTTSTPTTPTTLPPVLQTTTSTTTTTTTAPAVPAPVLP